MKSVFCFVIIVLSICSSTWGMYAERIIDHSPESSDRFPATNLIGAPDARKDNETFPSGVAEFDEVDSANPGFVIVDFGGKIISDITGNEVIIHLWDWTSEDNEPFEVFASMDQSSWFSLGQSQPPFGRSASSYTVAFDLSNSGLMNAQFIMIKNGRISTTGPSEGPDLDAIEVIPEPATLVLIGIGAVMIRRRK